MTGLAYTSSDGSQRISVVSQHGQHGGTGGLSGGLAQPGQEPAARHRLSAAAASRQLDSLQAARQRLAAALLYDVPLPDAALARQLHTAQHLQPRVRQPFTLLQEPDEVLERQRSTLRRLQPIFRQQQSAAPPSVMAQQQRSEARPGQCIAAQFAMDSRAPAQAAPQSRERVRRPRDAADFARATAKVSLTERIQPSSLPGGPAISCAVWHGQHFAP